MIENTDNSESTDFYYDEEFSYSDKILSVLNKNLPSNLQLKASRAAADKTPSGPPPIPKNKSTLYFSSVTTNAPDTSPSVISFKFTFNLINSSIISLCLGLSGSC